MFPARCATVTAGICEPMTIPAKGKMEPIEIEVKFAVADVASLRKRITEMGAAARGRHFELNVRLDDDAERLRQEQCLLRLRRAALTTLTFKASAEDPDRQFKIHRELEVQVSDFDTVEQILGSLGYRRRQVYEKWRETFRLDDADLCLDQMPFGNYLEIEGPKAAIRRVASSLGLDWRRRIRRNYLEMFSILQRHLQLPFSDVTFENFKNMRLDFDHDKLFA
jgi:adenylate cyclase class 2